MRLMYDCFVDADDFLYLFAGGIDGAGSGRMCDLGYYADVPMHKHRLFPLQLNEKF